MINKKQKLIKELETKLDTFRKMYMELGAELSKIEKDITILELIESGDLKDIYFESDLEKIPETPYFPNPSKPSYYTYYNPVVTLYGCQDVITGMPIETYTEITSTNSLGGSTSDEE